MKAKYLATLDLRNPESHRALVTLTAYSGNELPKDLHFPVWTPGSYLVREYSRHITCFKPGKKIAKNIWRLRSGAQKVQYEVYGFERTVRTTFIDQRHVALIGATLLPLLHGAFDIELLLPPDWEQVSSPLAFKKTKPGTWKATARDDDHWIDSPVISAAPGFGEVGGFTYRGIRHHIAWVGNECARPMKDLERDFKKLVDATYKLFGGAPFSEYWFLLQMGSKLGGGLEHRDSQFSQADGSQLFEAKDYDAFLRLIAHEYFHAWNVKSLRPVALGPFDYERENYTEDLWFAEGITDYFDDLIPLQAGLIQAADYQRARLKGIQSLNDDLPSQKRRSVAESSFDAWIRYYRADEDSENTDVSYYTKGALLGWCWDAELRKKSRGRWTLARLIKLFWKKRGISASIALSEAAPGYTRAELIEFAKKTTGLSHLFLEEWVTAHKPLPWREAARQFGVRWSEKVSDPLLHFAGLAVQWKGTQAILSKVLSESAAEAAGLAPGDELLAIGPWRVTENERLALQWKRVMNQKKEIPVLFSRMDRIQVAKLKARNHGFVGMSVEFIP